MAHRTRTLVAGLVLAVVGVTTTSAALAVPGPGRNGATVTNCRTLSGGAVNGVAVLSPGDPVMHGDAACVAWLNLGF